MKGLQCCLLFICVHGAIEILTRGAVHIVIVLVVSQESNSEP